MYSLLLSALTLSSFALAAPSAGCSQSSGQAAGTDKNYTITIGPHSRQYTVFLPAGYSSTSTSGSPLILTFHGNGKSAWQQESLTQMSNPYFNKDHIVVYPQGYKNHWQPGPYAIEDASDLDFTAAMLPKLQDSFCIDTERIYAAGKSVGGGFVSVLACDPNLGPKFAAFAPVSGAMYWDTAQNQSSCKPGQRAGGKTPMLEFHGLADTTIPYEGGDRNGVDLPDLAAWSGWWKVRNGCDMSQKPVVTTTFDGKVKRIVYQGCEMEHWKIDGLGHDWPSTQPNLDNPDGTYLNATEYVMEWFRGHRLSG